MTETLKSMRTMTNPNQFSGLLTWVKKCIFTVHEKKLLVNIEFVKERNDPIWKIIIGLFQNCGESVNSIEGGVFGTTGFDELVATTYTGEKMITVITILWMFVFVFKSSDCIIS